LPYLFTSLPSSMNGQERLKLEHTLNHSL
jgi:hypothetical protein